MESYDYKFLSHSISAQTPTYGNRDKFTDSLNSSFIDGSKAETSNWLFSNNHFGTHIDAPRHFIPGGKTITDFPASYWIFHNISLIEINCIHAKLIGAEDLPIPMIKQGVELILIKTGYEEFRGHEKYWKENPGIQPELGLFLRRNYPKLRAIGFDFISVTSFQHREIGREAHLSLLDGNTPILPIEDMSLFNVNSSESIQEIIVVPLRVNESNGAPVTVIAKVIAQRS